MLIKSMIAPAAAAIALLAAIPAGPASADVGISVGVGVGVGFGSGFGGYAEPGYAGAGVVYSGHRISCASARKIVRRSGFSDVRSLDCTGANYKFSGWRGGGRYKIKVNGWGEITRVSSY